LQQKSLKNHLRFKHNKEAIETVENEGIAEEAEGVFACDMPKTQSARGKCPVPGCGATIARRYGMRRHFMFQHPLAAVHFPDEGPLVECNICAMKVPDLAKHENSQLCARAKTRATKREQLEANKEATKVTFKVNGQPIETVSEFKYLGRVLSNNDSDWTAIRANIQKARKRWGQVAQILSKQGARSCTMAYFYKAVVQAVLLYGSESWVITERMWKVLNGFHNRCARFISGDHIRQKPNGEWILPSTKAVLAKCKLHTIEEYIRRRKRTVKTFVESRPIYDACVASTPTASNVNQKVWWN
jgi:hypothetical protein